MIVQRRTSRPDRAIGIYAGILNRMTETHRVRDLAQMIAARTGARIDCLPKPRNEADENDLHLQNDRFLALGLEPLTLDEGLMAEATDAARPRVRAGRVPKDALIEVVIEIGVMSRMADGRLNMPDLCRVAAGIGRRGGVRAIR